MHFDENKFVAFNTNLKSGDSKTEFDWLPIISQFGWKFPVSAFISLFACPKAHAATKHVHFPNQTSSLKHNTIAIRSNPSGEITAVRRASFSNASVFPKKPSFQKKSNQSFFKKDVLRLNEHPQGWTDSCLPRFTSSQDLAVRALNPKKLIDSFTDLMSPVGDAFGRHFGKDSEEMIQAKINKINAETEQILEKIRRESEMHALVYKFKQEFLALELASRSIKVQKSALKLDKKSFDAQEELNELDKKASELQEQMNKLNKK